MLAPSVDNSLLTTILLVGVVVLGVVCFLQ
jgi:hypothetical protein